MGLEPRQSQTLSIGAINPQMWIVDQDFSVPVTITGNPDEAYVTGDLAGFGSHYANGILTIEGHPEKIIGEKTFTIHANKGNQSITKDVIYSVITPAPVIESFGPLQIAKGATFRQQINISNKPADVRVTGPWIFLDHETNTEGVLIFGDIPSDKEFTIDSGTITIFASNTGGEHTLSGTANIVVADMGGLIDSPISLNLFQKGTPNNGTASFSISIGLIRTFSLYSPRDISGDDDNVYILFQENDPTIAVAPKMPEGGSISSYDRTFRAPSSISSSGARGIAIDGVDLWLNDRTNKRILRIAKTVSDGATNPSVNLQFNYTLNLAPNQIAVDDTYIYGVGIFGQIYAITKNTSNNGNASIVSGSLSGVQGTSTIEVDDDYIYVTAGTTMRVFNKSFSDGDTLTAIRSYTMPNSLTGLVRYD